MSPQVDVVYAANMKPGDWYAGNVTQAAPTTPVQPFAYAHSIESVTPYTDPDNGKRMLAIKPAGSKYELFPLPIGAQVLVIRGVS